ncbi:hypothetical protein D3C83_240140 [compost metagenome]
MGVGVETELRDVHRLRERRFVQGLDVGERDRKVEPLEIETALGDRIEHEAVVRTG